MDLKSSIHPAALNLMMNSATNASQKGQSQYSTPIELAEIIAKDLTPIRPSVIDLTCGPGHLLIGCANKTTDHLLGCDVDPRSELRSGKKKRTVDGQVIEYNFTFIHTDLTLLYPLMRQIDFRGDCFALNPPWSLNWHAERLEGLADSAVPAVAKTFKALAHGHQKEATIDSALATLMIALDRLTPYGEGFLIGYTSTLQRLLFDLGAIGQSLAKHIWKVTSVTGLCGAAPQLAGHANGPFAAATVIYFSRSHYVGPSDDGSRPMFMPNVGAYNYKANIGQQWRALQEKVAAMQPNAAPHYHLWLRHNEIQVNLGLFDTELTKVNRELQKTAKRLNDLRGRNPMQVIMQRDERNFILGLFKNGSGTATWTVDPALKEAVTRANNQYNATRAPLVPLPKIQRLGYLDEHDRITCLKDIGEFEAGESYALATRSVKFTRTTFKPNMRGENEELELSGQELAIYITARGETEYCFMNEDLRKDNVEIGDKPGKEVVDFTLQELVDHFEIPEVPDVAAADPERFQSFIEILHRLEQLTA